jgi:hypothetical protein
MGNTAALAYDIVEPVEYKSKISWTLHRAQKKVRPKVSKWIPVGSFMVAVVNLLCNPMFQSDRDEQKESVSLFRISKVNNDTDLALAQRTIQKLRTLK